MVRANNATFDYSIVDFPLMNLHDLITVAKILKDIGESKLQGTSKEDYLLGLAHVNILIDNYYQCLALTDVELASKMGKKIVVP